MLKRQRQLLILKILDKEQFVRVESLAGALKVSEVTIRRDINELAERNELIKVHGGAEKVGSIHQDLELSFRNNQNLKAKQRIARNASSKIVNGSSVYLDAGTTCAALIPYLKGHDLTVYTHGMHHISELNRNGITTYLLGGMFKPKTYAVVGALTLKYLEDISFDVAFIGFNGYDKSFGFSTPDEQEAVVKEKIIERSNKVYFLGDRTKIGSRQGVSFGDLEDGELITDN